MCKLFGKFYLPFQSFIVIEENKRIKENLRVSFTQAYNILRSQNLYQKSDKKALPFCMDYFKKLIFYYKKLSSESLNGMGKGNKVIDKSKSRNVFLSYTDKNEVLMPCGRGQLPELSHLSNNREQTFHEEDYQLQTHHLDYIKSHPRAKGKYKSF